MQMRPMTLMFTLMERRPLMTNKVNMINSTNTNTKQQQRMMVGRASNRSGVHGTHLPITTILDEEVEKEIKKGKEEKERKRKQVEETVDSQLKGFGQDPKSPTDG